MVAKKTRKSRVLRVAAVQAMTCPDPDKNVRRMEGFFKRARKQNVQVICFPEVTYPSMTLRSSENENQPMRKRSNQAFRGSANWLVCTICGVLSAR